MSDEMKLLTALCDALGFEVKTNQEFLMNKTVDGPTDPLTGNRGYTSQAVYVKNYIVVPKEKSDG